MDRFIYVFIYAAAALPRLGYSLRATNKLSLASWGSYNYREHKGPGTYAFGYDIEDPVTGNVQFRQEEKHSNGTITGSYGYIDADGIPQVTHYISDIHGYRILPVKSSTAANVQLETERPEITIGQQDDVGKVVEADFSSDNSVTNKIYNPPPLIYEFHGNAPFLNFYKSAVFPLPLAYRRLSSG